MSLRHAHAFLEIIHNNFIIQAGPLDNGTHSLTFADGKLILSINDGNKFTNLYIDKEDLDRDPFDLAIEIDALINNKI